MRRRRAAKLGPATFLLDRVAGDLADRLATVLRQFPLAADLATPGDAVRRALMASGKVGEVVTVDDRTFAAVAPDGLRVAADMEALPLRDASLDLPCRDWRCNSSTTCRAR